MDRFAELPEGCISEILSLTSPVDVCVFSVISKRFKSTSESDTVWNKFLPSDIQDIISRSSSVLVFPTKKALYLSLSNSPILLDGGKLSFSLDKDTGTKCFMVAAAELTFTGNDNSNRLQRKPELSSRFVEVAVLDFMDGTFAICGKISSQMLSKETHYSSYLVYKIISRYDNYFFDSVRGVCRYVDKESGDVAQRRASYVTLVALLSACLTGIRQDGWFEAEIGTFFNVGGNHGDVESRVIGMSLPEGLLVISQGIEYRPEVIVGFKDYLGFPENLF